MRFTTIKKMTEDHYAKYFMDTSQMEKIMHSVLGGADSPISWPIFGDVLPVVSSPSTAPQLAAPRLKIEDASV